MGWFMFFAGVEKLMDPAWSARDFLLNAQTFNSFYSWLAQPGNLWWIDPLNAWGIMLIGLSLLVGLFIRPAAIAGAVLMILYYFPQLNLANITLGKIVEIHIIYAVVFLFIAYAEPEFVLSKKIKKTFVGKFNFILKYI